MDRIGKPRGLIRYATEAGLQSHWGRAEMVRHILRPRVLIYGVLIAALTGVFAYSLTHRPPLRMDVVRDRAALSRIDEEGRLENVYRLQISNQSEAAQTLRLRVEGLDGLAVSALPATALPGAGIVNHTVQVTLPMEAAAELAPGSHPVTLWLEGSEGRPASAKTTFFVSR